MTSRFPPPEKENEGGLAPSVVECVRACVRRPRPSVRPSAFSFFLRTALRGEDDGRSFLRLLLRSGASRTWGKESGGFGWIIAAAVSLSFLSGCVGLTGMAAASIVHGDRSGLAQTVNLAKL